MKLFSLLLFLSLPAFADTFAWFHDIKGQPFKDGTTFQVYQDGIALGDRIFTTQVNVPSCEAHDYYVVAYTNAGPSVPSNTLSTTLCNPNAPALSTIISTRLVACQLESTKCYMALQACQGQLKAISGNK